MSQKSSVIGPNDVLCGRGGMTNSNNGNILFRQLVASRQLEYLDAMKKEKTCIARECVDSVHAKGGRFLNRNYTTGQWEEVPMKKAVTKASQALREGLDVKNKRLRESTKGGGGSYDEHSNKKRPKTGTVTKGVVVPKTSPALVSLSGEMSAVPELLQEENLRYIPPPPPPMSKKDYKDVAEV